MIHFKKTEIIAAIVIVVAFFLPWVSFGGLISLSGYELPNFASAMGELGNAFSEDKKTTTDYTLYIVYLVPLLSLAVLLIDYLDKPIKIICLIASSLNIVGFIYAIFQGGGEIGIYGVGLWITLLASIAMLLASLGFIKINQE